MFIMTLCAYAPEVVWLDEAAEALRNCASGLDSYLLARQNTLPAIRKQLDKADSFHKTILQYQRMVFYAIGVVSYHLFH